MTTALSTLLSPMVLFFVLGGVAAFVRSDLSVPESFAKAMSIYLMAAIGLKGGAGVAAYGIDATMIAALAGGLALSLALPLPAYAALRRIGGLSRIDAGAVAAHYGSVSVVTFVAAGEMLAAVGLAPASYMVAVLAVMETPAIVVGLWLARRNAAARPAAASAAGGLWHEVFFNGSVVLLIGSFAIGVVVGPDGLKPVAPVFDVGFRGILCLFLLDMGLIAVRRLRDTRALTPLLIGLGVMLPLVNGALGVVVGTMLGIGTGSTAALGVLAASASYIAVPAAMRMALPQADPGLSLGLALGVTFPFNLTIGIPAMAMLARTIG